MEQEFCMTRVDWVEYSTQSVRNVCIKVWYMKGTLETVCSIQTVLFRMENSVEVKSCTNRESKIL